MVVGPLLVFLACESRPRTFSSSGTLMLDPAAVSGAPGASPAPERAKMYLETQLQNLRSLAVSRRAAGELRLNDSEQEELRGNLRVSRRADALVLEVRVEARDPQKASLYCNAVISAYLTELVSIDAVKDSSRVEYLASLEEEAVARDAGVEAEALRKVRVGLGAGASLRSLPARVLEPCSALK